MITYHNEKKGALFGADISAVSQNEYLQFTLDLRNRNGRFKYKIYTPMILKIFDR